VKYAEELDCETIQVSIAHSYPGTELHDYFLANNSYMNDAEMTDDMGHQLPVINYPGLSREEIVQAVEHFYGRYYFRPRIVFRLVRGALFNSRERRRVYKEAREFLHTRSKRKQFIAAGANQ
jgi:hypothetical protein